MCKNTKNLLVNISVFCTENKEIYRKTFTGVQLGCKHFTEQEGIAYILQRCYAVLTLTVTYITQLISF